MGYKDREVIESTLLELPLDVIIYVPTESLAKELSALFPYKTILVNAKVLETDLTIHSSSVYWDWGKFDSLPQPSKVVTLISL